MRYLIPQWPAPSHIKAYTSTRKGGVSKGTFQSLNLGTHVSDDPHDVLTNRRLLKQALNLPTEPIWLNQTHSTEVVQLNEDIGKISIPTADAAITELTQKICVVLTADCLPVLLCDQAGTKVAAVHAGWRGLCAGILEKTVAQMQRDGSELMAWLGPAIGPSVFEVSDDVKEEFEQIDEKATTAFKPFGSKWLADIYCLATQRLRNSGVFAVYGGNHCTFSEDDYFYSFRRDGAKTGRMATLIWISNNS